MLAPAFAQGKFYTTKTIFWLRNSVSFNGMVLIGMFSHGVDPQPEKKEDINHGLIWIAEEYPAVTGFPRGNLWFLLIQKVQKHAGKTTDERCWLKYELLQISMSQSFPFPISHKGQYPFACVFLQFGPRWVWLYTLSNLAQWNQGVMFLNKKSTYVCLTYMNIVWEESSKARSHDLACWRLLYGFNNHSTNSSPSTK